MAVSRSLWAWLSTLRSLLGDRGRSPQLPHEADSSGRPSCRCCSSRRCWCRGRRLRGRRRLGGRALARARARGPVRLRGGLPPPARAGGAGTTAGRVTRLAPARRSAQDGSFPAGATRRCPGDSATSWDACRAGERASWCSARTTTPRTCPGFVGANDGASGTAVAVQLARTIKPRTLRRTVVFVLFDGEESPRGTPACAVRPRGAAGQQGRGAALPRRARDGAAGLRRRPQPAHPARGLVRSGALEAPARGGAPCGRRERVPRRHRPDSARRPPAVPRAGGAVDRPDRLRLPTASTAAATTSRRSPSAAST